MKLLLFDVDQTLINTGGAGIRALNRAFEAVFSMKNAMEGILPHGKTDPGIIREIFKTRASTESSDGFATSITLVLNTYLKFLHNEIDSSPSYKVLPGIISILDSLSGRPDVLLGLATGNVEDGARIKLKRGNLNQYFSFGGFGSDFEDRTELVRRAAEIGSERAALPVREVSERMTVFVIGDTPLDIYAGRSAGFLTVGVATGNYSKSELTDAGATIAISDFEQDRDQFLRTTRIE